MTGGSVDTVIQVFCKAPVAGTVKTRLMSVLTAEQAAAVHIRLTIQTLELVSKQPSCALELWCTPSIEHDFFHHMAKQYGCSLYTQQGEDLGIRMGDALQRGLKDYKRVLLIGCDCPSLTGQDIRAAIDFLQHDKAAVVAPAEDGGYVLLGLTQYIAALFIDMPWGTEKVWAITRERLEVLGHQYAELAVQWDVDYPDDLSRLPWAQRYLHP